MGSIELQPRPLYGIGTVARLTGIKPDTLRIWERRYQLGASYKSASGRRQYTQADLEHLQLVAALVSDGARIGEIASSERRTLEMMLRARNGTQLKEILQTKPRVAFIGERLCGWLDQHQGCLVNVDAMLAHCTLGQFNESSRESMGDADALVIECEELSSSRLAEISALSQALNSRKVLLLTSTDVGRWEQACNEHNIEVGEFPPNPALLAVHLNFAIDESVAEAGVVNLGDLVAGKPRLFSDNEIAAAATAERLAGCECPQTLGQLVQDLVELENCVSGADVDNWEEASLRACLYAYTGQARWLLERAVGLVLESQSGKKILDDQRAAEQS